MFKRNKRNVIIQKMFQNKTEDISKWNMTEDILKWNNTEDIKKLLYRKSYVMDFFDIIVP